jgi:PKD repeat protein
MLRRLFSKFLLVALVAFCFLALVMPNTSFAQGKSQARKVLISFRQIPGPNEQAIVRAAGGVIKYSYRLVPGIAASVPEAAIDGLSHNPNVTKIEDDLTVYAVDAELDRCWGVERIGAGTVHAGGNKGAGVKVAIIDSGIDYTHPDLNANYVDGYDFVNGDDDPMDDHGHGTHCSGIVAAEDNGTGAVGVAPDADLYGLKVLAANGSGSYSNVIAALNWCVFGPDGAPDTGDEPGIQVTSNSYGSSGYPGSMVELAFNRAEAAGIINVCAAGNSGNSAGTGDNMIYPARFDSCIAVAATTISDVRASFSSTGQQMELAAPGAGIYSTVPGGGYQSWSGTSMACPHVSGVVALMIKAGVADIRTTLTTTADDLGAPGWDPQYGYGLVNAVAAVGAPGDPDPEPVVAEFYGDTLSGDAPLGVQFYDLSSGNPTSWSWTFGDGGKSTARDPSHIYTSAGNYTVTLTAIGPGDSDIEIKTNYIDVTESATSPQAPVASFYGSPTNGYAPLTVHFTDQSTGIVESCSWNFGNGGSSNAENPSHTYTSVGTYTISLTVSNTGGSDTLTRSSYITVNLAPPPSEPDSIHVGDLDGQSIKLSRGNWQAAVTVTVHDTNHNPVVGALVTGTFYQNGSLVQQVSDVVTVSGGTCTIYSGPLPDKKGKANVTFEVSGVTYTSTMPYDDANNHDPDGDSDGKTIIISK